LARLFPDHHSHCPTIGFCCRLSRCFWGKRSFVSHLRLASLDVLEERLMAPLECLCTLLCIRPQSSYLVDICQHCRRLPQLACQKSVNPSMKGHSSAHSFHGEPLSNQNSCGAVESIFKPVSVVQVSDCWPLHVPWQHICRRNQHQRCSGRHLLMGQDIPYIVSHLPICCTGFMIF
jgi:hypothetical protein